MYFGLWFQKMWSMVAWSHVIVRTQDQALTLSECGSSGNMCQETVAGRFALLGSGERWGWGSNSSSGWKPGVLFSW